LQDFLRNADNLRGSLASAINDFRKAFAKRPVRIDLRESQIGHWWRLECGKRVGQADLAVAKPFQQLNGIGARHSAVENTRRAVLGQENMEPPFCAAESFLILIPWGRLRFRQLV